MTTPDPEPTLSWQEREIVGALRRLANARANLAALEAQAGGAPLDEADVARAAAIELEREQLRHKAEGRFGGSGARERLAQLEAEQRLVLERLGVADVEALHDRVARQASAAVDPTMLEFARRELDGAWQAWREIRDLELPPPEQTVDDDELEDGQGEGADIVPFDRRSAS